MSKKRNISDMLKEATDNILSDESLKQIEQVFTESVDTEVKDKLGIHVEKALVEQDTEHAEKLSTLLTAVDTDHTKKLDRLVEAIDNNHADKLKAVVNRYQDIVTEDATTFKGDLVNQISDYLELYLEKVVPVESIKEAVKSKKAMNTLNEVRNLLAVDYATAKNSIKGAIKDGKQQLDEARAVAKTATEENEQLKNELKQAKTIAMLAEKTQNMPKVKRNYVIKVLRDKTPDFITENFEYTSGLFDKSEKDRLEVLKEEAVTEQKTEQVDRPVVAEEQVIEEATQPADDPAFSTYMKELGKY